MIRILLVRHGLAGKPDPETYPDDDLRPLTAKGRKAFKAAAKGLRSQSVDPALILTSPVLRARQTADLLADGLRLKDKSVRPMPELHHAVPPAKALARLARMRLPRAVALVGHEPWLGEFLSLMIAGGAKTARAELDKGGAGLLQADSLGKGGSTLIWLMTQEQLASLA
jgi:phosphohistidine phosphatase